MDLLPKQIVDLIYLYVFADNNNRINSEMWRKLTMVKSKVDFIYCTQGKYYDMYNNRTGFDMYEHQYRHCKGCGCWIIATRLTSPSDKLYKCWTCDPDRWFGNKDTVNDSVVASLIQIEQHQSDLNG